MKRFTRAVLSVALGATLSFLVVPPAALFPQNKPAPLVIETRPTVPQLSDAATAALAKAAGPLQAQLADITTTQALLQQQFQIQLMQESKIRQALSAHVADALKANGIDPLKYDVDLKTMLVVEKPQPPTPAATAPAPAPEKK